MTVNSGTENQQPLWTREFVLVMFANLFLFMGFQMLLPTLPMFAVEKLGAQETIAGTVIGVLTISAVIIRPLAGRFADRIGRRVVYFVGLVIFIVCVIAFNWATSVVLLLSIRFIHGIGWGASTTAASTLANDAIPKTRLAEGMGYFGMTSTVAMAIGPAAGLALVAGGNFSIMFAVSVAFTIAALIIGGLLKTETKQVAPVGTKGSLFERTALPASLTVFFLSMTYGTLVSFIPIYARQAGINNIGSFFMIFATTLFVVRAFAGRIADKRGYSVIIIPGLIAVLGAMIVLSQADTLPVFWVAAVLYGIGFGAVQPSLQAIAVSRVIPMRRGAANATFLTCFDLGIGLGAILMGRVAESFGFSKMYFYGIIPIALAGFIYILLISRTKETSVLS